jgi:hypothetical protein
MSRTKIVFSYTETYDFQEPLEVTMEVPERTVDEMCEYFQRFLAAAGYLFEEGHTIRCVPPTKNEPDYSGCAGDILTFNADGTPYRYDFGSAYRNDLISLD